MYGRNRKLVSRNSSGCHFGDHTPWRRHFIGSQKPCFVDSTFRGPPLEGRPPIGDPSDSESIAPANVSTEAQEKEEAFLLVEQPQPDMDEGAQHRLLMSRLVHTLAPT